MQLVGGGNSNIALFSTPKIGEDEPNPTHFGEHIFVKWVGGSTANYRNLEVKFVEVMHLGDKLQYLQPSPSPQMSVILA